MDSDVAKQKLEDEKRVLEHWLKDSVTKELFSINQDEQDSAINLLCNVPVTSLETFFAHFEVVGHLRGLRSIRNEVQGNLERINAELKQYE